MANTSVIRLGGKTVALSVIGTAHTPVPSTGNTGTSVIMVLKRIATLVEPTFIADT